jgi:cold shock CspA family protein
MSSEYGRTRKAPKRGGKVSRPIERRGVPDSGRIVRLLVGQGHGFIRLANDREIFFHRSDLQEGTSINDFEVGDAVTFERLDDPVSGARALSVRPRARARRRRRGR